MGGGKTGPIQIGRYVLHDVIASGGMASVHFGRLVGTGGFAKTVAIKRLHRQFAREPEFRKMILEEGRLAARIRHPNVVPPLDVLAEQRELLLVMEYVHGESLSKLLRACWNEMERVPVPIASAILASVLHGLHAAHEAKDESGEPLNIVHRDVSPQNVIVGADGVARVIDFGIAKAVTTGESTSVGMVKGKVPYLAPEQLEGHPATRRTDVYAASVVFWETLAGQRLFGGADDSEILRQILEMRVRPPSDCNPHVPVGLDDIVLRGLARDPERRWHTARDMALAIEDVVHIATGTQIATWVERLAAEPLAKRLETLAGVEQAATPLETADAPTTERDSYRDLSESLPKLATASDMPPPTAASPTVGAPMTMASPPTMAGAQAQMFMEAPPTMAGPPPTMVAPQARLMASAPPAAPGLDRTVEMPHAQEDLRPPAAGMLRQPALEIRNVDWLPPPSAAQTATAPASGGRRLSWLLILAPLILVGLWIGAPFLVRRQLVEAAAKNGVTLTIDRVEVGRKQIRLVDLEMKTPELPGVVVHAADAVIDLHRFAPEKVTLDDLDVALAGAFGQNADRIAKWRTAHDAGTTELFQGITSVSVTSGRVEWKDPVGVGTTMALENVTADVTKNGTRALGEDWKVTVPLVTIRAGATPAGPWRLDAERQTILTRATLKFDPNGISPAAITYTASDDGSVTVGFGVPTTPLSELHVPAVFLGPLFTDRTRVEAHGEVSLISMQGARNGTGRAVFAGGNLAVFPNTTPVDVSVEVPVTGDATKPMPVTATLAIAPADPNGVASSAIAKVPLTGKLDVQAMRIDLEGKSATIPCVKGPGQAQLAVSIALSLGQNAIAKLGLVPSGCPPRIK
jgi:serine/threonine-protein kinase